MTIQDWLGKDNEDGIKIWQKKYQQNNETFDQWLDRICAGNDRIRQLIINKQFLFGGRILSSRGLAGGKRKLTYSNCYVVTPPEDNLESIFDCASKLARTYSVGGGCGIDVSKLSPRGTPINNAAKMTSGAVSFLELYSLVTGLIGQDGRRGALMISMDCAHPDIEEFVKLKTDLSKVTKANISIRMSNDFMQAVIDNKVFPLRFYRPESDSHIEKNIMAKELFTEMAKSNWDCAEPGMLFWDRIKSWNLLANTENFEFAGTNPCAEEPLPAGGSCLLGSMNLSEFVKNPFTDQAYFDFELFDESVCTATHAMNEVLIEGLPLHPLPEQRESVAKWRQIGLGIMGIADMLIKLNIRYGSKESLKLCDKIGYHMINQAALVSSEWAADLGPFDDFNYEDIASTEFFKKNITDEFTRSAIETFGLYNSQLLTIAPTGTISTMLQVSGGIEPIFAKQYTRKSESLEKDKDITWLVNTKIIQDYVDATGCNENELPSFIVTAKDIYYKNRIAMQSTWQNHIDASISSTVNVPNAFTVEDVMDLYIEAWKAGLKGITIYREGCAREGILNDVNAAKKKENSTFDSVMPISRKTMPITTGSTYCKKCACGTIYITLNKNENDDLVECFINNGKNGVCSANTEAVGRLISLSMRAGTKVEEIVDQLRGISCRACLKQDGKNDTKLDGLSCPDIISRTIREFQQTNNLIETPVRIKVNNSLPEKAEIKSPTCPECGVELAHSGGCAYCSNCGWSKCI